MPNAGSPDPTTEPVRDLKEITDLLNRVPPERLPRAKEALASLLTRSPLTKSNCKASVFVLYTGGTIGMIPRDPSNPASRLVPGDKEQLSKYVPGLGEKYQIFWDISTLPDEPALDSSDVNASHWKKMAEVIANEYENWDGFVILHGTDTMAYTASGLSFIFRYLAKPVVITGSQLPISDERTDARLNLANAIQIAGYRATGLPLIPEVLLCFGNTLLRGNRARKDSTSDLNGFVSPNYPPLGNLGEYIEINTSLIRPLPDRERGELFGIDPDLNTQVMDISLFPGLRDEPLRALLANDKLRGVIIRTFGTGNAMNDPNINAVLKDAIERKKIIFNVTQCQKGMVEMGLYEASSALLEMGVTSGLDITPEAALAKMFLLLGTESDEKEVARQLQINLRGEQSESLFDVVYDGQGDSAKPEIIYKAGREPYSRYQKPRLKRAVLRLSGLYIPATPAELDICIFVNLQEVSPDTEPVRRNRLAARFLGSYEPGQTYMADVTSAINEFTEPGRRINFTLVSRTGHAFWYRGLHLSLFQRE